MRRLLVTALLVLAMTAQAAGQTLPGLSHVRSPEFGPRDLDVFDTVLQLDDGQRAVVQTLLGDYRSDFETAVRAYRAAEAELRPEPIPDEERRALQNELRDQLDAIVREAEAVRAAGSGEEAEAALRELERRGEELRQQMRMVHQDDASTVYRDVADEAAAMHTAWIETRAGLRSALIEGVISILDEAQAERLPFVERRLRRARALPRGMLSGESVDLLELTGELDGINSILDDYEVELDAALVARDRLIEATAVKLFVATQRGEMSTRLAITDRQQLARATVRDVNDRYADRIARAVADDGPDFLHAYHVAAYPRIYRSTRTQRVFKAAREIPDLDVETLEVIASMESEYLSELETGNAALLDVVRRHEPGEARRRLEALAAARAGDLGGAPADPIKASFERRRAMGDRYLATLRNVLPEGAFDRLPGIRGSTLDRTRR